MYYHIKLNVSYDGASYLGWQKTIEGPSIEEELERALTTILQHPVILQAASRTDAGVHAEDQVVSFLTSKNLDLPRLHISLNQLLPSNIRINCITFIDPSFHPTIQALSKEYHYLITTEQWLSPFKRHMYWHFPYPLNLEDMQQAASFLIGRHDFRAFTNTRKPPYQDTVRELFSIHIVQDEADFCIQLHGDHFLYKMARNIAGTLCYIGCGKLSVDSLPQILQDKKRCYAGVTAPAHGLMLKKVMYPLQYVASANT